MSLSLTPSSQLVTFTIGHPTSPPSPTPARLTKEDDFVDLKDSVFSSLPPSSKPKAATITTLERRPWPSHSATRAHLPAHADIQVQRNRSPASPPKHRHVPARLSIMPRSSSGLVLATPTSMTSLTALLESETPMASSHPLSLAAELAQAEANSDSEPEPEPSPELEPSPETSPETEPVATFSRQDMVATKDVPPPYSQNVNGAASSVSAARAQGPVAGPPIVAPTALLPSAPIVSNLNHITPIPLSVLSARRPSTPMGRLMGAGGSGLNLAALGILSEPASPFSPGFNENPAVNNGFSRDPTGPLAFLANSQRTLALEFVSVALSDDLAALTDTNSEIDRLRAQLAAKEAERETQRAKIRSYQATLDKALTSLDEEKNQLIAMRERLFVTGLQQKDNKVLAGQSTQQALQKAKGGWCRLWIDA